MGDLFFSRTRYCIAHSFLVLKGDPRQGGNLASGLTTNDPKEIDYCYSHLTPSGQRVTIAQHLHSLLSLCETPSEMEAFKHDFREHKAALTKDEETEIIGEAVARYLMIIRKAEGLNL